MTHAKPQITDKQRLALLNAIRAGAKPRKAVLLVGISERTFQRWKAQAREGVPDYVVLMSDIKKAEAAHEQSLVQGLDFLAGEHDLDAIIAMLRMRHGWGVESEALLERILTLAESVLEPTQYDLLEQALIEGDL